MLRAEACFFRAFAYSRLITLWGDVPLYLTSITPEEAFEMGRTDKGRMLNNWNPWCNSNVLMCFMLLENNPDTLSLELRSLHYDSTYTKALGTK